MNYFVSFSWGISCVTPKRSEAKHGESEYNASPCSLPLTFLVIVIFVSGADYGPPLHSSTQCNFAGDELSSGYIEPAVLTLCHKASALYWGRLWATRTPSSAI